MSTAKKKGKIRKWFDNGQHVRLVVQTAFLLLILWIGFEFAAFVKYYQTDGRTAYVERPPGVEGFLPISSLMGIWYFFKTGDFNSVHPAGMVLFIVFLLIALFLKKGFCGWICPVGFLSEYLGKYCFCPLEFKYTSPVSLFI